MKYEIAYCPVGTTEKQKQSGHVWNVNAVDESGSYATVSRRLTHAQAQAEAIALNEEEESICL